MAPINRRLPPPTRRRALELLAGAGEEGCSEALLLAQGFTVDELVDLVRRGLATATPQPIVTGRGRYEVPILRITDEGRKALKGDQDVSRNDRQPQAAMPCNAGLPIEEGGVPKVTRESTTADAGLSEHQRKAALRASANAELDEILKVRPDLKGKTLEAAKRILRRERRLSFRPRRI
jgi:hypothetical protein